MTRQAFALWSGLLALVASLAFLSPLNSAAAQSDTRSPTTTDMASLESFIDGYVTMKTRNDDPAGMSVAVINGDQVLTRGYGLADAETGRAVDEDTPFRIGSISKLFVWMSVLMLEDEGKIDLDADVNTYLDGFAIPEAYGQPITMRDLMAHRAGFEDNLRDFLDRDRDVTLREAVSRGFPARVAPPGERTSYSNYGSNLAAYVVESASGMDYYDFVRTRILLPAGMASTTLRDPGTGHNRVSLNARMARPHVVENGIAVSRDYMPVRPQEPVGAVAMSARDAAVFMQLLLDETQLENGDRLLSEEAWQQAVSHAFPDGEGGDDMGYGFMLDDVDGAATVGHGGATKFLSWLFVIPSRDIGVFVSSNANSPEARGERLAWEIVRHITGTDAGEAFRALRGNVQLAEEVAGTYLNNRRPFFGGFALASIGSEIDISAVDGFVIVGGETRYAPSGDDIWVSRAGDRLRIVQGDNGDILRIQAGMGSATLERVSFWQSSRPILIAGGLSILLALTTFLGMWWRAKRPSETTPRGRKLTCVALVSAGLLVLLAALLVIFAIQVTDLDLATIDRTGFPPLSFRIALVLLVVLVVQAVIHLASAVLSWMSSGWSLWRRIHFSVFGLVLAFTMVSLWRWNVIGTGLYG